MGEPLSNASLCPCVCQRLECAPVEPIIHSMRIPFSADPPPHPQTDASDSHFPGSARPQLRHPIWGTTRKPVIQASSWPRIVVQHQGSPCHSDYSRATTAHATTH